VGPPHAPFDVALQLSPHPHQKRRFGRHEKRADDQACDVVDERRFAAFVIMADELNHPTHHEQADPGAEPDQRALLREVRADPQKQREHHAQGDAQRPVQAQVEQRRRDRRQQGRRQPQIAQGPTAPAGA